MCIQFSGSSSRHYETFLVKQNGEVTGRVRLFSVPGHEAFLVKQNSEITGRARLFSVLGHEAFSVKQVVAGRQNDAQAVEVPGAYTLLAESLR